MIKTIIRQIIDFFTFKGYQKFHRQILNHLNRYKLKIYYQMYILQTGFWSNLFLKMIILLMIKSIFFANISHNEALAFTDPDPRLMWDQDLQIEQQYRNSNGYDVTVHGDGSQTIHLHDRIKVTRDIDGSIEVKCPPGAVLSNLEQMMITLCYTTEFSPKPEEGSTDSSNETSNSGNETSEPLYTNSGSESSGSSESGAMKEVVIPEPVNITEQILHTFVTIITSKSIRSLPELSFYCMDWVKQYIPDEVLPKSEEDFNSCKLTQYIQRVSALARQSDMREAIIASDCFEAVVATYAACRIDHPQADEMVWERAFLEVLGNKYKLELLYNTEL